jgi:hypothetical protein
MPLDPILSEVRRIREEYAQQFHGDVRGLMDDLRRRHAASNRKSVTRPPASRRDDGDGGSNQPDDRGPF